MNDFIKRISNYEKINQLYKNDLFTFKSIAQHLNIWDNYSEEKKLELETLTIADSLMNGHDENFSIEESSNNLGYGEITKKGADKLYNYIKENIGISNKDVFYDIGSGNGKLVVHFGLISEFGLYKGVEINELRHLYSLNILKSIGELNNVQFVNKNVLDLDLSDAKIIFMNDLLFSQDLITGILNKLKPGTHIISLEDNSLTPLTEINLDVSWMPIPLFFRHYIK